MFDIGFWEMAVIGVIALLVIGPERLPAVARNVGRWVGTARRYVSHVKSDIERELHADEMRELLEQPEGLESIRDVARDTAAVFEDTRKELNSIANDTESEIKGHASTESVDDVSSDIGGDENADRLAPHHAVDEDPFASSSSMSSAARSAASGESPSESPGGSPGESSGDSWTESLSESSDHNPSDHSDGAATTDSTNEQRTGQPEQR